MVTEKRVSRRELGNPTLRVVPEGIVSVGPPPLKPTEPHPSEPLLPRRSSATERSSSEAAEPPVHHNRGGDATSGRREGRGEPAARQQRAPDGSIGVVSSQRGEAFCCGRGEQAGV